jgi:hypothetical protein
MAVSISIPAAPAPEHPAQPHANGPACAIRLHSGAGPRPLGSLTLWQLGIEAQEITTSIALLADQLASHPSSLP